MKSQYFPPIFQSDAFHCINCHVYAAQTWYNIVLARTGIGTLFSDLQASVCTHCGKHTYWDKEQIIYPDASPTELPDLDLPDECKVDYMEARSIFTRSPRAAAALLRLCVQKLMPHLGESGKSINDDIKSLVAKGLSPQIQQMLDYCRVIGNNAVHPGELDINSDPTIAQRLFTLINLIVEDRITRPREIADLYNTLPENARNAIDKRDGKTSS